MEAATHHHHASEIDLNPATWRDSKRYAWLLGLIVPLAPFIAWANVAATGLEFFWWFGPLLVFVAFPLLDIAIGMDATNPPDSVLKWLEQDRYYRWCTYAFIPLQYAGLVFACWLWSSGDLSTLSSVGLAVTMGVVAGIAINTAHELGHKRASLEKWLSKVALAQTGYGHFFIEHNRGHHVRVATPEDPASSRLGESFWAFLPRTVVGSVRSAWGLERERLGRSDISPWSWRNDILQAWAMTVVLFAALTAVFGLVVLPYLLIQALGFSCWRSSTTSSTTACCARSGRTAATSAASPSTAGTATTSPPTCSSTTCSATATTTPTRSAATRRCATSTRRRSCPPATRG